MSNERKNIITPVGRLAFNQNLFKVNDKGRYSVAIVFDKDEDTLKALKPLKDLINEQIKDKWGDKKPSNLHTPMKTEDRADMLEKYKFMENRVTLNASNGFEIPVIDLNNQEMFEGDIKAGDQVRLSISAYAYDNKVKGVGFNVNAVQFVRKDEPFYSRRTAVEMFGSAPKIESDSQSEPETTEDTGFDNFGF